MHEFQHADLGDERLAKRLGVLAEQLAGQPGASIPQATGNWGQACAAYRFFDNDQVQPVAILASHQICTRQRAATHSVVLAVQDTTVLNYTAHTDVTGLGPIGGKVDRPLGLWLHTTQAFTPEGQPLGLLASECWARDPRQFAQCRGRNQKPLPQKESARWLRGLQQVQAVAAQTPQTQWVVLADREADIYELFAATVGQPAAPALVVRLQHNRGVEHPARLLQPWLRAQPARGELTVQVPRHKGQAARPATLTLRFGAVTGQPPQLKRQLPALPLWIVEAREEHPPAGVAAIGWQLLSTLAVTTLAGAVEKINWYVVRWQIEVYHRVLKSGCQVEARQLETAMRLQRALAVDLVVAWRIMQMRMRSRPESVEALAEVFTESEWKLLYCAVRHTTCLPNQPPTLMETIGWLGRLGGHLGRKGDGPPGPKALWRGLQRLNDMTIGLDVAWAINKCA